MQLQEKSEARFARYYFNQPKAIHDLDPPLH